MYLCVTLNCGRMHQFMRLAKYESLYEMPQEIFFILDPSADITLITNKHACLHFMFLWISLFKTVNFRRHLMNSCAQDQLF